MTLIEWHPNPSAKRLQNEVLRARPTIEYEKNGFITQASVEKLRRFHPEIVLFNPQIPPNTGTVSRLCAAFSATLHLVEPMGFTITDKQLRRAGLDYWTQVEICLHKNWDEFLKTRHDRRFILVETGGHTAPHEFAFEPGDILVFGAETYGIPQDIIAQMTKDYRTHLVTIPMYHRGVRSINLSNTVSIVMYEAMSQLV